MEEGIGTKTAEPRPPSSTTSNFNPHDQRSLQQKWQRKLVIVAQFFSMNSREWLDEVRKNLGTVAALICTISFQAALNPPGGVVESDSSKLFSCGEEKPCNIGQAVSAILHPKEYQLFINFNTFSFIASLLAALLLVSGMRLQHRALMSLVSIAMSASLTSLAFTYYYGILLVIPDKLYGKRESAFKIFMGTCITLLLLVMLANIICLLVWFWKKWYRRSKSRCQTRN